MVPTEPYMGKPGVPGVDREPAHLRNTYNMEDELYEVVLDLKKAYEAAARKLLSIRNS